MVDHDSPSEGRSRIVFGALMVVGLLAVLWLDDQLDFVRLDGTPLDGVFFGRSRLPTGLLTLVAFLTLIWFLTLELSVIFEAKGLYIDRFVAAASAMIGCSLIYVVPYGDEHAALDPQITLAIFATLIVLVFLAALLRHAWLRGTDGAVMAGAASMFMLIYLGLLPGFFVAIRRWHSAWVVAAMILIIKSCDIGAYYFGKKFGGPKLAVRLSPEKTWAGFWGGIFVAACVGGMLALINDVYPIAGIWVYDEQTGEATYGVEHFNWWRSILAGATLGLFGHAGDLTASLFKRDAGLKDSGRSIPGFGGMLDVADSVIIAGPVAFWLLVAGRYITRGEFP